MFGFLRFFRVDLVLGIVIVLGVFLEWVVFVSLVFFLFVIRFFRVRLRGNCCVVGVVRFSRRLVVVLERLV